MINAMRLANSYDDEDLDLVINRHAMLNVFMPLLSRGNETEVFQMAYTDAVIELTFLVENVLGNSSIEKFQAPLPSLVEKYK